jgi:hypothetical protein
MRNVLSLMVFIAVLGIPVSGQESEKDRWLEDFDIAATRFEKNFAQLLRLRGIEAARPERISVARSLCPLLAYYPDGTAGLVFYYHEGATLKIWVLDDDGIEAFARRDITADELVGVDAMLKSSLYVESLQASRAPRLRGEVPTPPRPVVPRDLEESLRLATEVLLPPDVGRAISTKRHLIIVPVLNIGTVPFAILKPFGDGAFLIDRMSLSIAPSLSDVYVSLDRYRNRFRESPRVAFTSDNPLIVGNPLFPQESDWALPQLPGAELEALSVARTIGGRGPLVGDSATESRVLSGIEDADFLYFATHGVASAVEPLDRSFLAFASDDGKSGFLTAREIQQTRLRADIAVLSACQTGLGDVHDAGIIGLSRAFQLAGVPHVVMSLWNVYDDATRELMELFIAELKAGGDFFPADSLRAAMRRLREKRPDPGEWASFVVFGIPY